MQYKEKNLILHFYYNDHIGGSVATEKKRKAPCLCHSNKANNCEKNK